MEVDHSGDPDFHLLLNMMDDDDHTHDQPDLSLTTPGSQQTDPANLNQMQAEGRPAHDSSDDDWAVLVADDGDDEDGSASDGHRSIVDDSFQLFEQSWHDDDRQPSDSSASGGCLDALQRALNSHSDYNDSSDDPVMPACDFSASEPSRHDSPGHDWPGDGDSDDDGGGSDSVLDLSLEGSLDQFGGSSDLHTHHRLVRALRKLETCRVILPAATTPEQQKQLTIHAIERLAASVLVQLALATCFEDDGSSQAPTEHGAELSGQGDRRADPPVLPYESYDTIRFPFAPERTARPRKSKQSRDAGSSVHSDSSYAPEKIQQRSSGWQHFPQGIHSAKQLAMLLRVAEIAASALGRGEKITLRDIYYRDVPLFGTQVTANKVTAALASLLGVRREQLNIFATAKGLVTGPLSFAMRDGSVVDCTEARQGILIPSAETVLGLNVDPAVKSILLVEKDAVFQSLSHSMGNDQQLSSCILITGKGYPDVATRQLLHALNDQLAKNIPIFCLVDADPHGLDIFSVYKYGSAAMHRDNGTLDCRGLRLLGLRMSDIAKTSLDDRKLLTITPRDVSKCFQMLERAELDREIRREIVHMLHLGKKAEIQIMEAISTRTAASGLHGPGAGDNLLEFLRNRILRILQGDPLS